MSRHQRNHGSRARPSADARPRLALSCFLNRSRSAVNSVEAARGTGLVNVWEVEDFASAWCKIGVITDIRMVAPAISALEGCK